MTTRALIDILTLLGRGGQTEESVCEALGIHRATLFRHLATLRSFGVQVEHRPDGYHVLDYGIFDRRRLAQLTLGTRGS